MKVIKCSDETYAFVCQVAAERKTYLADAVDFLVFKQGLMIADLERALKQKPKERIKTVEKVVDKPVRSKVKAADFDQIAFKFGVTNADGLGKELKSLLDFDFIKS